MSAMTPRRAPQLSINCQVFGIYSSFLSELRIQKIGNTDAKRANTTIGIVMDRSQRVGCQFTLSCTSIIPTRRNMRVLEIKLKNHQKFSITGSTRGEILFRP